MAIRLLIPGEPRKPEPTLQDLAAAQQPHVLTARLPPGHLQEDMLALLQAAHLSAHWRLASSVPGSQNAKATFLMRPQQDCQTKPRPISP